jgi:transposase InsO family protein
MPTNQLFHPSIHAALLLLGRDLIAWPEWPSTEEILQLTGSGKSQAYAMAARLRELLENLAGKPGRPVSEPTPPDARLAVTQAIQDYLMCHPGSAYLEGERYCYLDDFRRFVVGLVEPGQPGSGLSVAQLSDASRIPLGTLKGWFGHPATNVPEKSTAASLRQEHRHQILDLYQVWEGNFTAFGRFVREEHRLNYGDTAIRSLLQDAGLLQPRTSKPATPNRGSYQKLFPGAQWLGDGSVMRVHCVSVQWNKKTFLFNLEAVLDVASNALVSVDVSDSENEAAVLRVFQDGIATAGEAPLSLSLDNKPCNHTPTILEATKEAGTVLLPTTPYRPQSKAPLEGLFGLFKQCLPELILRGDNPRELARTVLKLVFSAWARGRNGKPRKNLGHKSPVDHYLGYESSPEQEAEARRYIEEQRQKQVAIRRTREERADPVKLEFLKKALLEMNIADPNHRLAVDLAYYPRDSIVDGIATFQAKSWLGTVPPGADPGRYLRGIISKVYDQAELSLTAEFHLQNRLYLRDLSLGNLVAQEEEICQRCSTVQQQMWALIDRALNAPTTVDYNFWAMRSADTISGAPVAERASLYRSAAKRIAASYRAERLKKQSLLSRLARVLSE